jgi:hypothetical protein
MMQCGDVFNDPTAISPYQYYHCRFSDREDHQQPPSKACGMIYLFDWYLSGGDQEAYLGRANSRSVDETFPSCDYLLSQNEPRYFVYEELISDGTLYQTTHT